MKLFPIFIFFFFSKALGDYVIEKKRCVGTSLDLACQDGHVIEIQQLMLGDSSCYKSNCCPKEGDCRKQPSFDHNRHVLQACTGRQTCRFDVEKRGIGCSWYAPNNDYELVRYRCNEDPRKTTKSAITTRTTNQRTNVDTTPATKTTITPIQRFHESATKSGQPADLRQSTEDNNLMIHAAAHPLHQEMEDKPFISEQKIARLEAIVIPMVAGLIITTLIISIACIVSKSMKLKYLRQKTLNHDPNLTGMYLQPISYQTLVRTCADETPCQTEERVCDTYDCIKDVCCSLEDGYLKPLEVIRQTNGQNSGEEDRYVIG